MIYFVSYKTDAGEQLRKFWTHEKMWEWLQEYKNEEGHLPHSLSVYKAESLYDGS
jgi:hypothetical protein